MKINVRRFIEYAVLEENISAKLLEYYNKYPELLQTDPSGISLREVNPHVQMEYDYIKIRTDNIQFIDFQRPASNFQTYNFKIGYIIKKNKL